MSLAVSLRTLEYHAHERTFDDLPLTFKSKTMLKYRGETLNSNKHRLNPTNQKWIRRNPIRFVQRWPLMIFENHFRLFDCYSFRIVDRFSFQVNDDRRKLCFQCILQRIQPPSPYTTASGLLRQLHLYVTSTG